MRIAVGKPPNLLKKIDAYHQQIVTQEAKIDQLEMRHAQELGKLYLLLLLLALAGAGLGVFLYLQQKKRKQDQQLRTQQSKQLQQLLDEKAALKLEIEAIKDKFLSQAKVLTTKAIYIYEQNQSLISLKEQLTGLQRMVDKTTQPKVQQILKEINLQSKEETWQAFEKHFLAVNQNFYQNLAKEFPQLSPNEKRLCAYLRINMNSKEIATLLHISHKSVEVARSRLRKKLSLTNKNTSLHLFLSKF
ncbi:MAG: helix-turn-helix transcriptional regulator [Saprospiraceae bacterium]